MNQSATISAWTRESDPRAAFDQLVRQIGEAPPAAIICFVPPDHDGAALTQLLAHHYSCPVAGCTTAGEISNRAVLERGVSALALGADKVVRAATSLVPFDGAIGEAVRASVRDLAGILDVNLREADPKRYVGIVLVDGLSRNEEELNHALGTAAPGLLFVGGSAGDDLRFEKTTVFADGASTSRGAALMLMEVAVPIAVTKSYSAESTGKRFRITKADAKNRTVYEVDGRPVLEAYAEVAGVDPDQLGFEVYVRNPWALLEGDDAWLRSPKGATADGGLEFFCAIREGMELTVMRQTPIIAPTRAAFADAAERCGGQIGAAVIFNCVYRRIELDQTNQHREYAALYEGFPTAGFHTYGESLIAHINQTCTALFFG